ncbi:unnamed protein product [Microthlaspi erraticum]|uniref:Uncharacterized protein n=1 Tax=Microthlaspi erraticum TaxID=1685480 RepID=A0A6D2HLK4_9BRAS|nr:unnamed protein product [Microthlaspi erraticum]
MGGSCNLILCNCRSASEITDDYVKNKIEICIQKYMTLEETMKYLQDNHQICHKLTQTIWEKLQEESPEFFKIYYLRCKVARQTKQFNELLAKQVALMLKAGNLDINSPEIVNLLCQYPEVISLMNDQASTSASKTETVSSSLALPYTNGPSVTQLQVQSLALPYTNGPTDPQMQIPSSALPYTNGPSVPQMQIPSLAQHYTNGPSVTQLQIPNDQQNQLHPNQQTTSNDLPYGYAATYAPAVLGQWPSSDDTAYDLGASNYAPAAVDRWPSSNDQTYGYGAQPYTPAAVVDQWSSSTDGYGAPTFAPAANTPQYPLASILDGLGDVGQHDPIIQAAMERDSLLQLQDLYEQYQPQMPLQQNFPIGAQAQQMLQPGEGSNGLQNGESFDQRMCHNFDTTQPMRMCTSVDQRADQPGGGSNGLQNGESFDQRMCHHNFDTTQPMRMCTSVDQQQARGVTMHPRPDSKALDTPHSGK